MNQLHQQRVQEYNKEDFDAWINQPETRIFINYLKDFQDYIGETYKESMIQGNLHNMDERTLLMEEGKCVLLEDVINVELEDIKAFYDIGEEEE